MVTRQRKKKRGTKAKGMAGREVTAKKKRRAPKKLSKRKRSRARGKPVARKRARKKRSAGPKKRFRTKALDVNLVALSLDVPRGPSGLESGDLQGLSNVEAADTESVDELLEEGNAFEAGIVAGVEEAEGADEREVRTHQIPVDDVPEEYLDED